MRIDLQALRRHVYERWERALVSPPPVACIDYTFDLPLAGDGWHARESDGTRYWRFTGPGERVTLHLPPCADTVTTMTFEVLHTVTPAHPHAVMVFCNAVPLPGGQFDGRTIAFTIPPEAVRGHDRTELA